MEERDGRGSVGMGLRLWGGSVMEVWLWGWDWMGWYVVGLEGGFGGWVWRLGWIDYDPAGSLELHSVT